MVKHKKTKEKIDKTVNGRGGIKKLFKHII